MGEPFESDDWQLPALAVELEAVATRAPRGPSGGHADAAVHWACEQLRAGATVRDLCDAAIWCGLRNARTEGRGPFGLVTHAVLAAHATSVLGELTGPEDDLSGRLAAVQLCAYTAGAYRGGANDPAEGPSRLAWYDPTDLGAEPLAALVELGERGETDLFDHAWLAAAAHDPVGAEQALVSVAASGYHLNEHKLVYPAQLRAWLGDDAALHPVLFRAAARYAGNHLQSAEVAETRRADAAALAEMLDAPPTDGTHDLERVSVVATGIARTPHHELSPLLLGSLQDELAPEDLVLAVALVNAERFASTSFEPSPIAPVGPVHSGTGTNAVRRCIERARSDELRFELALCAPDSPTSHGLARIAELSVPPFDDGALEDLRDAVDAGDPDAASEAASAVPPDDAESVRAAWSVLAAAAARDQWMVTHAVKHVVAMHEDFHRCDDHPARVWFLAAAARTAAHVGTADQPVADQVVHLLD